MNLIMNLIKAFKIHKILDNLKDININSVDIEIELYDIIENLIDEIKYDDNIDDEIEIYDDDIIELFDLKNELINVLNNKLFDRSNEIKIKYYDDIIYLINEYDDDYYIFENDIDEIKYEYDIDLKFDNFNYYNSNNDLILYRSSLNNYYTIDYYEIDELFDVEYIVDMIFEFKNI